jgi:hypothetical protein
MVPPDERASVMCSTCGAFEGGGGRTCDCVLLVDAHTLPAVGPKLNEVDVAQNCSVINALQACNRYEIRILQRRSDREARLA